MLSDVNAFTTNKKQLKCQKYRMKMKQFSIPWNIDIELTSNVICFHFHICYHPLLQEEGFFYFFIFLFYPYGKRTLDCTFNIWKALERCFHSISLLDLIDQRQSCIWYFLGERGPISENVMFLFPPFIFLCCMELEVFHSCT